ncbi:hypothetical protein G6F37_008180 [Rhizopus arrhizus]|nr:hypothetical protein G6F38_008789 [Rhizopus arrhizus]KAG1155825.1 hypothetical protein G6F37_008180 [Rhizopus arrhizus]
MYKLHSSPVLSFLAAAKGKLKPSIPRVVKRTSPVTFSINCCPSVAATSTGSSDYFVIYIVPSADRHLDMGFLPKLRQEYPYRIGYGKDIAIFLHLDDVSSVWFRSNGYVLVETTGSTPVKLSPSYKVDYNAKTAILVT